MHRYSSILSVTMGLGLVACGGLASTGADGGEAGVFSTASCTSHPSFGSGTLCHYFTAPGVGVAKALNAEDQCPGTRTDGPCASSGLVGCCITSGPVPAADGATVTSGSCFYAPETEMQADMCGGGARFTTSP
jgi:hypothetical protein